MEGMEVECGVDKSRGLFVDGLAPRCQPSNESNWTWHMSRVISGRLQQYLTFNLTINNTLYIHKPEIQQLAAI